jgi:heme oxygenase (mycobilin-producing)
VAGPQAYRVVLRMQVLPGLQEQFEEAWSDGARAIAQERANLGQWLSRSDDEENVYYIVSDWVDEPSFREYERSERHRLHRARLHPYRSSGSMTTMRVVEATTGLGAQP